LHWSCGVVLLDEKLEGGTILMLDSFNDLSAHPHAKFAQVIRTYLNFEKREAGRGEARTRKRRPRHERLAASSALEEGGEDKVEVVEKPDGGQDAEEPVTTTNNTPPLEVKDLIFTESSMPHRVVRVPKQQDGHNCGVYMLESCERVMGAMRSCSAYSQGSAVAQEVERHVIKPFSSEEAAGKRNSMCLIMRKLHKEFREGKGGASS
jgi:hypothetical protein